VSKAVSLFDKLRGLLSLQEVELTNACIGIGVSETLCLASNCSRAEDEVVDVVARHTAQLPADLRVGSNGHIHIEGQMQKRTLGDIAKSSDNVENIWANVKCSILQCAA
jgi:hypothetical protein